MESLYILIPIAIVLVCIAVGIFLWAVKSEQFEDLERPGHNILFDEDINVHNNSDNKPSTSDKQSSPENQSSVENKNNDA